jgi:hypothetical protein
MVHRPRDDDLAATVMTLPDERAALVSAYLSKGGEIRRLPSPETCAATEVLDYLKQHGLRVMIIRARMGSGVRFILNERPISQRRLIELANKHRQAAGLPEFQVNGLLR